MKKHIKIIAIAAILAFILPTIALASSYVGNTNSYKFHYASCRFAKKMKAGNKIIFNTREEAVNYGMTPCGVCRP